MVKLKYRSFVSILIMLMSDAVPGVGQQNHISPDDDDIEVTVDLPPTKEQRKCKDYDFNLICTINPIEPPGDIKEVMEFIGATLKYPDTTREDSIGSVVLIRFWVDSVGYTSEHKIVKSVRKDLDDEVLRVARLIKFSRPPMLNGKPVGFCYLLPIRFPQEEIRSKSPGFWKSVKRR